MPAYLRGIIFVLIILSGIALPIWSNAFCEISERLELAPNTPPLRPYPVVRLDDSTIEATVSAPKERKSPAVLVLQGSGCASERNTLARLLLPWRKKYVFIYVEKPGITSSSVSCNSEFLSRNSIHQRLWDILSVIQKLRTESWWNNEIYVIGISEGGLIAGLTAAYVPEVKRVAILSYGGALTMGEWWPDVAAAGIQKETGSISAAETERNDAITTFRRARSNPSYSEVYDGESNTLAWWASIIDVRLSNALVQLSIPILICHGELDQFAPVKGARAVAHQFIKLGKNNLTYREYPGLDHGFVEKSGNSKLESVYLSSLTWLLGDATTP